MALQPKIIACGNSVATFAMAIRFLTGPAVMAAASIAVGLRGTLLHVAIVQVANFNFFSCIYVFTKLVKQSEIMCQFNALRTSCLHLCHTCNNSLGKSVTNSLDNISLHQSLKHLEQKVHLSFYKILILIPINEIELKSFYLHSPNWKLFTHAAPL